jgi:nitroreductase
MQLAEMIVKRQSIRRYEKRMVEPETVAQIFAFIDTMKPLYADIGVKAELVEKNKVKSLFPWVTPQVIAIFSEDKEGMMENVGFLYQQLDLYLQSIGLGTCWLGVGRPNEEEIISCTEQGAMQYVIMMSFGYPKEPLYRDSVLDFRRKELSEIADEADSRLEPARLAPSSMNSQPWYFVHDGQWIHVYCVQKGVEKAKKLNRLDTGIALAQLYISNVETFRFVKQEVPERKGYSYIGSISI